MNYFENKSVVIIGATGVFGQLMAQNLSEQGAKVIRASAEGGNDGKGHCM
jgi:NADP-dependent 3-hydroxy acid dehydrogenase YdfG